jgi:hypothetical protein
MNPVVGVPLGPTDVQDDGALPHRPSAVHVLCSVSRELTQLGLAVTSRWCFAVTAAMGGRKGHRW